MIFKRFEVGPLMVNAFLIGCEETGIAAVIDPGDEAEMFADQAIQLNLQIQQIIITHGHADHIAGVSELKRITGAEVFIHAEDAGMLTDSAKNFSLYFSTPITVPSADKFLTGGESHHIGNLEFEIRHVPGHSPGSICLVYDGFAIVGDTIFAGSIGRTDFPKCSHEVLVRNVTEKILTLPDNCRIYPGHGPETTVSDEKQYNPFFS